VRACTRTVLIVAVLVGASVLALRASIANESGQAATADPNAGGNSKCYVCHPTLKTEEITTQHLAADVTCDECHGASTEHMHDEMLMTQPDLLFGRSEVIAMCSNPTCHAPGEGRIEYGLQDHMDPAKVQAFHKEWLGRIRPNGRAIGRHPICTDCHGTHNLDEPVIQGEQQAGEWLALFNRADLTGWQATDASAWTVQRRSLTGRLDAPGKAIDLLTQATFDNYLLAVTFRAQWPVRAGLWLRHTPASPGPRVEIMDRDAPPAFTGSLFLPGRGLALTNLRRELTDREGWNTLSVKVEGRKIQVWLNGEEIGAVLAEGPEEGRIGIHLEAQADAKAAEIQIREVQVQRLPKDKPPENRRDQ